MISEICIGEVSAEYVSHATFVAKINELIRAQNAVELAATDSQHAQLEMPPFDELWPDLGYDNSYKCIGYSVYEAIRRHFKRVR